jgi:hypothetical protein
LCVHSERIFRTVTSATFYDREDGALEVLSNEHYAPQYAEVARDLGALCS